MSQESELIRRSTDPDVLEFPLEKLDGLITPNDLFFIRNHYPTPTIDASKWQLAIEGLVNRPGCLDLDDLKAMPKVSVQSMLECAGNGRTGLNPPVPGVQWACGAVGNAIWSGVSLNTVLETVGVQSSAVDIVFEGADRGPVKNPPKPVGDVPFARSLPIELALSGIPILAYEMNGEPIPVQHGFPVRLIVPGWYAVASVKWLTRILAIDRRFTGYYQTTDYTTWEFRDGSPQQVPIGPMPVKSVIARPAPGSTVRLGEQVEICGAAWAGESEVTGVEVSVDGGSSWDEATVNCHHVYGSLRHWSWTWKVDGEPGERTILCRARDASGRVQPLERNWNHGTYVIDHSLPVQITVVA